MSSTIGTYRIQKDLKEIVESSWEDAPPILAVPTNDSLTNLTALVIGPPGSCYHGAFLTFSMRPTAMYPNEAPNVRCLSTGEGRVRLNPNLYADGKVCLSVLGTYRGEAEEAWRSSYSLRYILQCIQSMVLNEEPYHNEPGFSKETSLRGVQLLLPPTHPGAKTPGLVDLGERKSSSKTSSTTGEQDVPSLLPPGSHPDNEEPVDEDESKKGNKKKVVHRYLAHASLIQQQAHDYHEKITHESLRIGVCDVLECLLPTEVCKPPKYSEIFPESVIFNDEKERLKDRESSDSQVRSNTKTPEFDSPQPDVQLSGPNDAITDPQHQEGEVADSTTMTTASPDIPVVEPPMENSSSPIPPEGEEDPHSATKNEVPLDAIISNSTTPQTQTPVTTTNGQFIYNTAVESTTTTATSTRGGAEGHQPLSSSKSEKPEDKMVDEDNTSPSAERENKTTEEKADSGAKATSFQRVVPASTYLGRKNFLECTRVDFFSAEIKRQFLLRYSSYLEIASVEERLQQDGKPFTNVMFEFPSNTAKGHFAWRWLLERLKNIKRGLDAELASWMMKGVELTSKKTYEATDLVNNATRISETVPCATGTPDGDNAFHWNISFMAPEGLYEEGFYSVDVSFCPKGDQPPRCRFVQPIWHPNISPDGYSVYFLWDDRSRQAPEKAWTPVNVAQGLFRLLTMKTPLQYPACVLNEAAAKQCFSSTEAGVKEYRKEARRLARKTLE